MSAYMAADMTPSPKRYSFISWRGHDMERMSVLLTLCEGIPPVHCGSPSQKPKLLNKQLDGRWFWDAMTSMWWHCNVAGTLVSVDKLTLVIYKFHLIFFTMSHKHFRRSTFVKWQPLSISLTSWIQNCKKVFSPKTLKQCHMIWSGKKVQ